jgi:hypothetical protein
MIFLRSTLLRTFFALALPLALVAQLVAIPTSLRAKAWVEICTVEGMVKLPLAANGEPVEQSPARGHDLCDLCLPAHVAAPPDAPAIASGRAHYEIPRPGFQPDAPARSLQTGPPIGARGPPLPA